MSDTHLDAARALVAGVLELPLEAVPLDGSVDTIPAWDSVTHVRILLAIEAETGHLLDSELIATLSSVSDVARALAGKAPDK
ncbi:acyl carrier protein [Mesorhizobium sp. ANAO-SY3R2]|uniref:acyl carrier protein n=1 Tax=Mesorhizobium sp. ANAO-SY3R2 TaxID=3166644 RepID=UPI00366F3D02